MQNTVKDRVRRGINWLDNSGECPKNWRSLLDIEGLRFAEPDRGPIGQLFDNNYYRALNKLRIIGGGDSFGFRSAYSIPNDPKNLKEEWKQALKTDKTWYPLKNALTKEILGVTFCLYETEKGNINVLYTKSGCVMLLPRSYANYDSAKRAVRKLISRKAI